MARKSSNQVAKVDSKKTPVDLPPEITEADTKYTNTAAKIDWSDKKAAAAYYAEQEALRKTLGETPSYFTFYKTAAFGWCLMTLDISKGKRGNADRSYGVVVADGKVCRCGNGPHVLKEVVVYLTPDNLERLKVYIDLWRKGMADAGTIRDRISTRRAQGQQHRAAGRNSWMW